MGPRRVRASAMKAFCTVWILNTLFTLWVHRHAFLHTAALSSWVCCVRGLHNLNCLGPFEVRMGEPHTQYYKHFGTKHGTGIREIKKLGDVSPSRLLSMPCQNSPTEAADRRRQRGRCRCRPYKRLRLPLHHVQCSGRNSARRHSPPRPLRPDKKRFSASTAWPSNDIKTSELRALWLTVTGASPAAPQPGEPVPQSQ